MSDFTRYRLVKRAAWDKLCVTCRAKCQRNAVRITGRCSEAGPGILTHIECLACFGENVPRLESKAKYTGLRWHHEDARRAREVWEAGMRDAFNLPATL